MFVVFAVGFVIGALISTNNTDTTTIADGLFVGCCAVIVWATITLVIGA